MKCLKTPTKKKGSDGPFEGLTLFFCVGPPRKKKKKAETATKNQKQDTNCPAAPAWIFTYICLQVVLIVRISTHLGWNECLPSVVSLPSVVRPVSPSDPNRDAQKAVFSSNCLTCAWRERFATWVKKLNSRVLGMVQCPFAGSCLGNPTQGSKKFSGQCWIVGDFSLEKVSPGTMAQHNSKSLQDQNQNLKRLFRWFCLPKNTFWRSSQTKGKHEFWEHYLSKSTNPLLYPRHKEGNGFQPRMWHKPPWLLHLHILRNQLHQWTAHQTIASMVSSRSIKSHEL